MADPAKSTVHKGNPALDRTVAEPPPAPPLGPSTDAGDVLVASRIGRYVLLRKLGEGGMGVVYAAYDEELDRKVAVKLLRDGSPTSAERRMRILREAQAMARVSHPNVVSVYEVGEMNGRVFIAMEFVEGTTLTAWQESGRSWSDILRVYLAAAEGLYAAHQAGLVHRDFKPDNVLVGSDGRPRVADFGLARSDSAEAPEPSRSLSSDLPPPPADCAPGELSAISGPLLRSPLTVEGTILGTPAYMAPEQHRGALADSRSDAWSFCAALYEALFRQMPFPGDSIVALRFNVLQGRLRAVPHTSPVPRQLERALRRGLSVDPVQRFPSMRELITALSVDVLRDPSAAPLARRIFTFSLASGILASAMVLITFWLRGTLTMRMLFLSALVSLIGACSVAFSLRNTLLENTFHRALVKQVLVAISMIAALLGVAELSHLTIAQVFAIDMVSVGGVVAMIAVTTLPSAGWIVLLCALGAVAKLAFPSLIMPISVALYPLLTIALGSLWNHAARRTIREKRPDQK